MLRMRGIPCSPRGLRGLRALSHPIAPAPARRCRGCWSNCRTSWSRSCRSTHRTPSTPWSRAVCPTWTEAGRRCVVDPRSALRANYCAHEVSGRSPSLPVSFAVRFGAVIRHHDSPERPPDGQALHVGQVRSAQVHTAQVRVFRFPSRRLAPLPRTFCSWSPPQSTRRLLIAQKNEACVSQRPQPVGRSAAPAPCSPPARHRPRERAGCGSPRTSCGRTRAAPDPSVPSGEGTTDRCERHESATAARGADTPEAEHRMAKPLPSVSHGCLRFTQPHGQLLLGFRYANGINGLLTGLEGRGCGDGEPAHRQCDHRCGAAPGGDPCASVIGQVRARFRAHRVGPGRGGWWK